MVGSPEPPPGFFSPEYEAALEKSCAGQNPGRYYFPAPDETAANDVARITHYLAQVGAAGTKPTFVFHCRDPYLGLRCRGGISVLADLAVGRIAKIEPHDCLRNISKGIKWPKCFDVTYSLAMENGHRVEELRSQKINIVAAFNGARMRILSVGYEEETGIP